MLSQYRAAIQSWVVVGLVLALVIGAQAYQAAHPPQPTDPLRVTAILGNNSQVLVTSIAAANPHIKAGKLRSLAGFGAQRASSEPDVPTLKELGYDVEFALWVGLFAPKGTPKGPVDKVRDAVRKAVASEQFKTAIHNIGDEVAYLDQPQFAKFWDEDAKRVESAVKSIGRVQG